MLLKPYSVTPQMRYHDSGKVLAVTAIWGAAMLLAAIVFPGQEKTMQPHAPQPKLPKPDDVVGNELLKLNATLKEIREILQAMNANLSKIAGTRL